MKTSLTSTIETIVALQLINYFTALNIKRPANTDIWFEEIFRFLTFKNANIESVIQLYDHEFKLKNILKKDHENEEEDDHHAHGDEEEEEDDHGPSFIDESIVLISIAAVVSVVGVVLGIVALFIPYSRKMINK